MKNIHILPTEKEPVKGDLLLRHLWKGTSNECISWWRYNDTITIDGVTQYTTLNGSFRDITSSFKTQNIYITSDEEIKEGDWILNETHNIEKAISHYNYKSLSSDCKKIILTTDVDLIKDGVQAIDDEFLEWFVKNPSCDSVGVKKESEFYRSGSKICGYSIVTYKIIIPEKITRCCGRCNGVDDLCYSDMTCDNHKERGCEICYGKRIEYQITIPKEEVKQKTLEEAAYKLFSTMPSEISTSTAKSKALELAKWQATRLYDVEEVYSIVRMCLGMKESGKTDIEIGACLERYKKK